MVTCCSSGSTIDAWGSNPVIIPADPEPEDLMTSPYSNPGAPAYTQSLAEATRVTGFLQKVYGWMSAGLAITAAVAWIVASTPVLWQAIVGNQLLFFVIAFAPIGFVWYLNARAETLAPSRAAMLFVVYAALNGLTLSVIFLAFTTASIATTFLTAACTFGALAVYGSTTRRSLQGVGQFAFMGLIGVLIASVVGLFWQNDMFQFVLSACGVVVFTCLTAYKAQQLKSMALALPDGQLATYSVVGALSLYLSFINLFLFMLRLFGRRR
jgi:FtsH-binding integral membrane protein